MFAELHAGTMVIISHLQSRIEYLESNLIMYRHDVSGRTDNERNKHHEPKVLPDTCKVDGLSEIRELRAGTLVLVKYMQSKIKTLESELCDLGCKEEPDNFSQHPCEIFLREPERMTHSQMDSKPEGNFLESSLRCTHNTTQIHASLDIYSVGENQLTASMESPHCHLHEPRTCPAKKPLDSDKNRLHVASHMDSNQQYYTASHMDVGSMIPSSQDKPRSPPTIGQMVQAESQGLQFVNPWINGNKTPPGGEINCEKDPVTNPDICSPASSILNSAVAGPQNSAMKCEHENGIVRQGFAQPPGGAHELGCCNEMKLDSSVDVMSLAFPAGRSCCPSTHPGCKMKHSSNKLVCTPAQNTDENSKHQCPECDAKNPREQGHYKHILRNEHSCDSFGERNQQLMVGNIFPPFCSPGN